MTVVDLVMERLAFQKQVQLTDFLGINRSCIWHWRKVLDGKIPSKHWGSLTDEAKRQRKKLTLQELRGG
jgi:hypothetical protein